MRTMQHSLEAARGTQVSDAVKEAIVAYNADDCFSTQSLRDWLEQRADATGKCRTCTAASCGIGGSGRQAVSERQQRSAALAEALKRNIPVDPELRSPEQAASWLLADLLDWHRREAKAEWWEFFRMKDLTDEDLLDERSAIAGLTFVDTRRFGAQDSDGSLFVR